MRFCTGAAGKHNASALVTPPQTGKIQTSLAPQTGKNSLTPSPWIFVTRSFALLKCNDHLIHYYIPSINASVKRLFQLMVWLGTAVPQPCKITGQDRSCPTQGQKSSELHFFPKEPSLQVGQQSLSLWVPSCCTGRGYMWSCDHWAFPQLHPHHGTHRIKTPAKNICPFERQHCSHFS